MKRAEWTGERVGLDGIASYRDLIAWQRAMDLVDSVYDSTANWPPDERYGLAGQAKRAAVSVPANIAEGRGRTGNREFAHHLSIAHGSLCEVETLVLVASRRRFIVETELNALLKSSAEVGRLLNGLIRSLKQSPS